MIHQVRAGPRAEAGPRRGGTAVCGVRDRTLEKAGALSSLRAAETLRKSGERGRGWPSVYHGFGDQ